MSSTVSPSDIDAHATDILSEYFRSNSKKQQKLHRDAYRRATGDLPPKPNVPQGTIGLSTAQLNLMTQMGQGIGGFASSPGTMRGWPPSQQTTQQSRNGRDWCHRGKSPGPLELLRHGGPTEAWQALFGTELRRVPKGLLTPQQQSVLHAMWTAKP
ncbi:hypothetical protein Tdes44962_MAKER05838 [Teratosphaeria destructans]|uniref:Uncharacterized protein n=1 Tax=Teratosphaeria destructans TaxID=418781 RepID=A0A9W7VYL3_9PEZI|nr:hypothetical protein Tdes44962_MAKER05838 [Teratosphaeria destructans]